MQVLRTPNGCFSKLEGYAFAPHYLEIADEDGTQLRIHYIDEGPHSARPILLMHGNPAWSYLYRHMIPPLVAAGHRVIAVDLVGTGRSDKPAERDDYSQARHCHWMQQWLRAMQLEHITLFCQDWGGTIGLHLVSEEPERFDRVIASNTGLPEGRGENDFMKMWLDMMRNATEFPFDAMLPAGMCSKPSSDVMQAYKAPFPTPAHMAGILAFPLLIAVRPGHPGATLNRQTWSKLEHFDKPFLTLFGGKDVVSRGAERELQNRIPGATGWPHKVFPQAGHFIQEDMPELLVEHMLAFISATP